MPREDVDKDKVRVSAPPPEGSAIRQLDDVIILVEQAFCPNGHNLIDDENEKFDGYPGIRLRLESEDGVTGEITLSPFHGDDAKRGKTDWANGQRLRVSCPTCDAALPRLGTCHCESEGDLIKLYLSPALKDSHLLALCNIWGCRRSRTIDSWQIISEFLEGQVGD